MEGHNGGTCTCRKKNRTLEKSQGGLSAAMHTPNERFPLQEDALMLEDEVCAVLGAHASEEDRTIFSRGSAAQACFKPKAVDTHLNTSPPTHPHISPQTPNILSKNKGRFQMRALTAKY